jgi:hypothetical protein
MHHNTRKLLKPLAAPLLKHLSDTSAKRYHEWLKLNNLSAKDLEKQKKNSENFDYRPLISIIVPAYNTAEIFFREMIESVLKQTYQNWELILVDDASTDENVKDLINEYAQAEARIIPKFLVKNHHISGATNEGIKLSKGEFISLLDHDDLLWPDALYEVVKALNKSKNLNFIYTDEDKLDASTKYKHCDPFFKPDWNPDLLRSVNYITHFTTIRRSILEEFGYENSDYDGAQDWELFLRITRNVPTETIHHVPKILYSWRIHSNSTSRSFDTKPYVIKAQHDAIEEDLRVRGMPKHILERDPVFNAQWRVGFSVNNEPSITFVLPNQNVAKHKHNIKLKNGAYQTINMVDSDAIPRIINQIKTEYTMFVFEPTKVINEGVIKAMLGDAQRTEIAFVVAGYSDKNSYTLNVKYLLRKECTQLVKKMGGRSLSSHIYRTTRYNIPIIHEASCALIATEKLRKLVKGKIEYRDIKKISKSLTDEQGYWNLYIPYI